MMRCIEYSVVGLFLTLLNLPHCSAQADTVWMTTQGGLGTDQWNEVVLCDNGDLLVVGTTSSDLVHGNEVYLARLDSLHHCIWTRTLGEFGVELGHDVVEDSLGRIWCLATVNGSNTSEYDMWLLQLDEMGNLIHHFLLEREGIQFGQKMAFNGQHQIMLTGTEANTTGGRDVLYYLWDTNSFTEQVFYVECENQDLNITVTEWDSIQSEWFIAGNALMPDSIYQVVGGGIATLGISVWENMNDPQGDSLRVFDAVWKNNYWVLAGCDWVSDNWRAQIVKWTPGQALEKMSSFAVTGAETLFHSVVHRSTGNGFVFGGWTYDMGAGMSDAYVHAFDDNFNWDGGAIFGGSKEDKIFAMVNDQQGNLHWVGMNGSYNTPMQLQGWVARLNAGFVQSSNIHSQMENDDCFALSVSPMKEQDFLSMQYLRGELVFNQMVYEIKVYHLQGSLVISKKQLHSLPVYLAQGCYIIQWERDGKVATQKLIIY